MLSFKMCPTAHFVWQFEQIWWNKDFQKYSFSAWRSTVALKVLKRVRWSRTLSIKGVAIFSLIQEAIG